MTYDEALADRVRKNISKYSKHVEEKKMFGGIAFMYKNKMACGIVKDELMIRVVTEKYEDTLKHKGARIMNFTGKVMKDFLYVNPKAFESDKELQVWIELGIEHADLKSKE